MKIILSRKGFDSANGGCPSPVLPDGTMLSMPIPVDVDSGVKYDGLYYGDSSYLDIWRELRPAQKEFQEFCHLDPDLRKDIRQVPENWQAAFGQVDSSQSHLQNMGVGVGDLFLFFGWFCRTEYDTSHQLRYIGGDKHMLFGYLQIGGIVSGEDIARFEWHPHSDRKIYNKKNNTIYIAAEKLSGTQLPGYGTFRYHDALVLTKEGCSRSRWELPDFFEEVSISHHNADSFRNGYFQSVPIGQEFVISEDDRVTDWAYEIIRSGLL